jgi:tetratricopeptide (TPR) repeat protein
MNRLLFACLGGIVLAARAFAQPCLLSSNQPPLGTLETYAGPVQPKLAPVEPPPEMTIALLPDLLSAEQRERLGADLIALDRSAGKATPLRLAVFDGHQFAATGPLESAAAWRRAVREALATPAAEQAPADPAQLYSAIIQGLSSAGANWSSVVLVGHLPDLPKNLQDYARAWVPSRACAQKLRVSYFDPGGARSEFWDSVAKDTGGAPGLDTLAEVPASLHEGLWSEVAWAVPAPARGFVLDHARLNGPAGVAPVELPVLAAAASDAPPDLARYAELQTIEEQLSNLERIAQPDASQVEQTRTLLARALAINARDPVALRTGADLYRRGHDFRTAADLIDKLLEVRPRDPALEAELGHDRFLAGDMAAAEKALLLAREKKAGGAAVSEELARIHLARKDDTGALPFLEETLALAGDRADLWFIRADVASRLGNWDKRADSLERGLAINRQNLDRRTSLVQLYLEHAAGEKAVPHVHFVMAEPPKDAAVRAQYAGFLDQLGRPAEALAAWKKALESDPSMERAHYRVARLLLDGGAVADGLAAAETGLTAAPGSARLYLLKSEGEERQGRYFDARETLRSASRQLDDVALLARLAEMEDVSGHAPQAYMKLWAAEEKAGTAVAERKRVLERGIEVAIRDEDPKAVAFFRDRLSAAGDPDLDTWFAPSAGKTASGASVPGGLDALAFIAHSQAGSPQSFFAGYCRTLLQFLVTTNDKQRSVYLAGIQNYFQQVASLKSMGTPKGSATEITISIADKKARQRSEKILNVLGWKLRANKNDVSLEAGEKKSQAGRQEAASALALDEVGIEDALQSGKPYSFEIPDESAPVLLSEAVWMNTFFGKTKFSGGFAEALAGNQQVARTYAALSAMSPRAVAALTAGSDLKMLAEKHSDLLYRFSSAFALRGEHAAVPGGPAAEPIWEKMAGAPPSQPGRFFHSLLEKDEGKLLAFFATLGQVDTDHQRFFTRSLARTTRFYALYRDSMEVSQGVQKRGRNSSFTEFLREVPLDSDLHVLFPGGPEVWMLAKGTSSSTSQTARMAKKLSRIATAEAEDDILDRLARTRYKLSQEMVSELDHFLAVVRIDEHRPDPLDAASALLLAQHYGADRAMYPYFASLTGLTQPQFEHFFTLAEQLRSAQRVELNVMLGELHSLIELISLAQEAGALDPAAAAGLFDSVCVRFGKAAGSAAGYTAASLDTLRDLLQGAAPKEAAGDPDRALEHILLGQGAPATFDLDGASHELDSFALRRAAYERVLAEQKVTTLKTLFEFYGHLQDLTHARGPAAGHVQALDSLRAALLVVLPPKKSTATVVDRRLVVNFDDAKVAELITHLRQRTAKKKVNQKDVEQLSEELAAAICPQVKLALSGAVYAYFLNPNDLLVSQDPLFLRKHRFLTLESTEQRVFTESELQVTSERLGSYIEGGFADFPITAGQVALSGGQSPPNTEAVGAAQMGSLRATNWNRLEESDLLLFDARLRAAREWILRAGADGKLLAALADDTQGILSPNRRSDLLDAVAARDWSTAFKSVTLGDLYALSGKYLERYPDETWRSPVTAALRGLSKNNDGERLRWLGPSAPALLGCSHPHLDVAGPYEEYEKLILPFKLAQRSAEFKLYLADFAARAGIPPTVLSVIGQPLTLQMLKHMRMTDLQDWRDALAAFGGLNDSVVQAVLPGEK